MIKKLFLTAIIFFNLNIFASNSPTLSNFRNEDNSNRVYFDSNEIISGTTFNGFVISGKSITGISINSGANTGHFFTVSTNFTFWDNNTIRYEGNANSDKSNIIDAEGNGLRDFTLTYITNNIPEPAATSYRYVNVDAKGGGNGLSESSAWTWAEAVRNATSGQTVWIKAGLYNLAPAEYTIRNSGTVSSPIKFIGYKSTIGDISTNYYTFTDGLESPLLNNTEMPTFDGNLVNKVYPLLATDKNYIIVRNLQITESQYPIRVASGLGWVVENCNIMEPNDSSGAGTGFHFYSKVFNAGIPELTNYRFKNVNVINSEMSNIFIEGRGNLIDNGKAYSDTRGGKIPQSDYLIVVQGNDNIIRNSFASTLDASGSLVHGIGIKGYESNSSGSTGKKTNYNLIDNCVYTGSGEGYYVRNEAHYNVIKNSTASGGYEGISIRTGASFNIFENLKIENQTNGVGGRHNREIGSAVNITTQNNIIRNCTFNNIKYLISFHMSSVINAGSYKVSLLNNKFQNCTFNDIDYMNRGENQSHPWILSGNTIENCILTNVRNENYGNRIPLLQSIFTVFDHNNYWNSFTSNLGTNSSSDNPQLDVNLKLTPSSPSSIYDGGVDIPGLYHDADGIERQSGKYSKGAYDNEVAKTGSVSPDVIICTGENTILTASGGTSYMWDSGETTESIIVSPAITTTYTVTITDGINSDSHDVKVTVDESPTIDAGEDVTICSGEELVLTATGNGSFLWSTGETTESITVSPTSTTTYSVTSSNSCATDATDEVVVTVNETPILTVNNPDNTICLGESLELMVTSNGNLSWSTGETTESITVSPTATTTYTITSNIGDCAVSEEILVTVSQAPSVDAGEDVTICSGEELVLTATGNGSFLWSTGETTESITVSPTSTTTYSVTSSNSCATDATDEVIVTVNETPVLSVSNDISINNGDDVILKAFGEGNFLWNTGETTSSITVNPLTTSIFTVTLTSLEGCSIEDSIEVTVINGSNDTTNTEISADAGDDVYACLNSNTELTATGGGLYLWSTGEITATITVSPTETTTYYVTVSDGSDIDINDVDEVTVYVDNSCSDIENRQVNEEFKVYPNPTNGILHIELIGYQNELNISLFNSTGTIIYSENINNYSLDKTLKRNINLKRFGKGIYYARIANNGENSTKKVIVI